MLTAVLIDHVVEGEVYVGCDSVNIALGRPGNGMKAEGSDNEASSTYVTLGQIHNNYLLF